MLTSTAGAAVTEFDEGIATQRHGARDQGAHLAPAVTEAASAAVVPRLAVLHHVTIS